MLDEQIQESNFIVFDFGDRRNDMISDEVGATGFGGERNGLLGPGHDCGFGVAGWG